jgi:hypothetical protein
MDSTLRGFLALELVGRDDGHGSLDAIELWHGRWPEGSLARIAAIADGVSLGDEAHTIRASWPDAG